MSAFFNPLRILEQVEPKYRASALKITSALLKSPFRASVKALANRTRRSQGLAGCSVSNFPKAAPAESYCPARYIDQPF